MENNQVTSSQKTSTQSSSSSITFGNIFLGGKVGGSTGNLRLSPTNIVWRSKVGAIENVDIGALKGATWYQIGSNIFQLELQIKGGVSLKFDGFNKSDYESLKKFFETLQIDLKTEKLATKGYNWGEVKFRGTNLCFMVDGNRSFEIPLSDVSRSVVQKDTLSIELNEDDATEETTLSEIRFYVPPGSIEDGTSKDEEGEVTANSVQIFHEKVMAKADIVDSTGKGIVVLKDMPIVVPRGKYNFEMFSSFMKVNGPTYDYKVKFQNIVGIYQLPKPDDRHVYFVLTLDPPIKQGSMRYGHMVLQFPKDEETTIEVNIPEDESQKEKYSKLQPEMKGRKYELCSRIFKALTGKKVVVPKEFVSATKASAVRCSYKANEGYLFPMDKSFFFLHKPPLRIRYDEISHLNFARVTSDESKTRTFDIAVILKTGQGHTFMGIQRNEYDPLIDFITSKNIRIDTDFNQDPITTTAIAMESESDDEDFEEESEEDLPEEYDEEYEHPLSDEEGKSNKSDKSSKKEKKDKKEKRESSSSKSSEDSKKRKSEKESGDQQPSKKLKSSKEE